MKQIIVTIILAIIAIAIAGCDVTYHHVRHQHGHHPRAVIVTRPPVYWHGPNVYHRHRGHRPGH
ncbi:MAG: hypothetical protein JSW59_18710 [Phycisphaerales bacterium]|nr:MAG: hypothetical protein JSW59_18710 [Phycisphaerales bacterium]